MSLLSTSSKYKSFLNMIKCDCKNIEVDLNDDAKLNHVLQTINNIANKISPKPKHLNYKVGQELYSLSIDDDGKCSLNTYKISCINKKGVYAILLADFTWGNRAAIGKTFSKTKDYGWLPNIHKDFKYFARKGESFATYGHLHTTKRAAWADPFNLKYFDDPEDAEIKKRVERSIKTALSKIKNGQNK